MKQIFTFLTLSFFFVSCEEVIDLQLDSQEKQLVVDAAIDWEKGTATATPTVHLSFTRDYFSNLPSEEVRGAKITISTYFGEIFRLKEMPQNEISGGKYSEKYPLYPQKNGGTLYVCQDVFTPEIGKDYILTIDYQGVRYTSEARMREVPSVNPDKVVQNNQGGFLKDKIELRFFFEGISGEQNAYMAHFPDTDGDVILTADNAYFSSEKMFFSTSTMDKKLEKNDKVRLRLHRISADYKQVTDLLRQVGGSGGGGAPAGNIPTRVFGNIINENNPKQNPLGAFRVSQFTECEYIVK